MKNVELTVEKLVKFMQQEIEKTGLKPSQVFFNFSPSFTQRFIGYKDSENIPEGEDLTNFRNQSGIDNDAIFAAIKVALSRSYVSKTNRSNAKKEHLNDQYNMFLSLSNLGYSAAIYIDDHEVNVGTNENQKIEISDKYFQEKKKGGANSYQKYQLLRTKVKDLCKEEMQKSRKPDSASQLCLLIADKIEENHPDLLKNFMPYQAWVKGSGADWLKPTFYEWCNAVYKEMR